jgi:hypothetical protein
VAFQLCRPPCRARKILQDGIGVSSLTCEVSTYCDILPASFECAQDCHVELSPADSRQLTFDYATDQFVTESQAAAVHLE